MQINRKDFLAVIFFFIITLFFFRYFLDGRIIMAFKDLSRYFYPLRYLMVEQVKAGQWPLWNPYIFCGFPLLATLQICFFYPLSLIYYLLPFNLAFNYYIIVHYFLAACFMYTLLRYYRFSWSACFFGGVTFAYSGYLLTVANMNTSLSSVIWLPLILMAYDRLLNQAGNKYTMIKNIIWLTLLFGIMFLGGEPTILYVTFWLLVFYGLVFSKKRLLTLGLLLVGLAISFCLISAQLFPFIELAKNSDRTVLTGYDFVTTRSFPPSEIVNFVFPYFFGNQVKWGEGSEEVVGKNHQDWIISPYLGIFTLILLLFSFKWPKSRFFLWAALIALIFSLGRFTPIYWLAYKAIPGIAMIRFPAKYIFMVTFCLTVAAAAGFNDLYAATQQNSSKTRKLGAVLIAISTILFIIYLSGRIYFEQILTSFSRNYSASVMQIFLETVKNMIRFNLQSVLILATNLTLFSLLLWETIKKKINRKSFIIMVLFLAMADLLSNNSSIIVGASTEPFSKTPENYRLMEKDKSLFRFYYTPNLEKKNRTVWGEDYTSAIYNAKKCMAADWHLPYHFYDFWGYESIEPIRLFNFKYPQLTGENYKKNIDKLSSCNVKYIFSMEKLTNKELILVHRENNYGVEVFMYKNMKAVPRAYLIDQDGKNNKGDKIAISLYKPGRINFDVDAQRKTMLFLSEAYYPGWQFTVDGKKENVLLVNELFSGVVIKPGQHNIEYVYDPWTFKAGLAVSTLTVMAMLATYIYAKRKEDNDLSGAAGL